MSRRFVFSRSLLASALAVGLIAPTAAVSAEEAAPTLSVGDSFPVLELEDQFEEARAVPGKAARVVFSGSKDADDDLSETLGEVAGDALRAGEIVYLSDISRMPGLITRFVAMPALKDRDYPVTLIREEGMAGAFSATDGCYTLYTLNDGTIEGIDEACDPAALRSSLSHEAPAASD